MRHPEVDVVVVGMGWAGGIVAAECAKHGLSVVGLERGIDLRGTDILTRAHDELRFGRRRELVQDTSVETWTLRHDMGEVAMPLRYPGAFLPGDQVGGSGVAWGGATFRLPPTEFERRSAVVERYGTEALPAGSSVQDWPISYADLEPYYERFENMAGVSGKAGNINGSIVQGGNPFEGPRASEYPLRPHRVSPSGRLFADAATKMGLHPFPLPSAALSAPYTNPDGISRTPCTYGGFCSNFVCEFGAKASSMVTVIPVAEQTGRFELRTKAYVTHIEHDGHKAHGVRYIDAGGEEHEQSAAVVVLAAYAFNNTRLLLLSGLGTPYDPEIGTGSVGKNFGTQLTGGGTAFFRDQKFNSFMGTTSAGRAVADYADFDHSSLDFVGGGLMLHTSSGQTPLKGIALPPGSPRYGGAWKRALREWYGRSLTVTMPAQSQAYRDQFLDLDPTYRDAYGLPLVRMTFNWKENERKLYRHLSNSVAELFAAMDADAMSLRREPEEYWETTRYQGTHISGGAIMGDNPATSVVNRNLQMWDCENVFVVGASAFPQSPAHAPTDTVGALAYLAADSITIRYAKRQGSLV
jgi:gluconate 2-dehydrogenase alpha chain